MKGVFGRLVGFTTLPLLSALTPLLALPIVARVGGVDGWAAILLGQAIGTYFGSVATAGWNAIGPAQIALERSAEARADTYRLSLSTRLLLMGFALPASIGITWALSDPATAPLSALFAAGATLFALSFTWYAVGLSSPRLLFAFDLAPKLAATIVSVPLVLLTQSVSIYGFALIIAPLVGLAGLHLAVFGRLLPRLEGLRPILNDLRARRSAWLIEVSGSLYSNAPVPVASTQGTADAAAYGTSDRLYRYGLMAAVALGNALQGWVLEASDSLQRTRQWQALVMQTAFGLIGFLGLWTLGPLVSAVLFGSQVAGPPEVFFWLGVAFFGINASTPLMRNMLLPAGRSRYVLIATLIGAAVGMVLMLALVGPLSIVGVAMALAISEFTVYLICVVLVARFGLVVER